MPDNAGVSRSVSTIRTELEYLQNSGILSPPQLQSIMAQLPVSVSLLLVTNPSFLRSHRFSRFLCSSLFNRTLLSSEPSYSFSAHRRFCQTLRTLDYLLLPPKSNNPTAKRPTFPVHRPQVQPKPAIRSRSRSSGGSKSKPPSQSQQSKRKLFLPDHPITDHAN